MNESKKRPDIKAPVAEKKPKELVIHNDVRIDNYYWLNERENPEVIKYLEAENQYTDTILSHTKKFQEDLFQEMKGRIKERDESVPYKDNGYWYYTRYEEGKEYPVYCRKKESLEANEEILLDVNILAEGHDYYQAGGLNVSPNNKMLAFAEDTLGRRLYSIRFLNLESGELLEEKIINTTGGIAWTDDNKTLFYTLKNTQTLLSEKINKHILGQTSVADKTVYAEKDKSYYIGVTRSKSDKYIIIYCSSTLSSDYHVLKSGNPEGEFKSFSPREKEHEYSVYHFKDKFYILTNWNATNFRLMETPENDTGKENWTEVIPHREDVLLERIELFNDYMALQERKNGIVNLKIRSQKTNEEYFIDFTEPVYTSYIAGGNLDFDSKVLRFGYTSMTTPYSTFEFNMQTRKRKLLKQQEVLGGFNKEDYITERIYAPARDGESIPVSIVYNKSFKKNGKGNLLLYGYGSYGNTVDPSFSSVRLSLLNRGFAFAIAHIRGSQTKGRAWYDNGKMFNKKNTFNDFIDAAKYLVKEDFTNPKNLYCMGGSAGGLLIGAVINMEPKLFNGAVAQVPFVDVVTTMLDESIPLTTNEFDEWGNPKNKDSYDYMLSYSPYDNVSAHEYPNLLVTTGLHDSQVQYWEPAKWIAKLREMKTDNNLLLLHTDMDTGHSGSAGRFDSLKEIALEYAFILDLAGLHS